jgi:hypothetical protein
LHDELLASLSRIGMGLPNHRRRLEKVARRPH